MFLLVCLLSGLADAGAGEDPFFFQEHYKSRESHFQVGRVSWPWDPQCAQIFWKPSLLRHDFESQRRDVLTLRRLNVATSIIPFLEHRDVEFQRHDVDFKCLCHTATWIPNVATSIFMPSGTSRRE